MSGFLDKTGLSYLWEKVKTALSLKQDKLSAGDNITIDNNVISASAGEKNVFYGTCSTSGGVQNKVVECNDWEFKEGNMLYVLFTYKNIVFTNISIGGQLIPVKYGGNTNAAYMWDAGEVVGFAYVKNAFQLISITKGTTSMYGVVRLSSSVSSASSAYAATSYAVKQAYDLATGKQNKLTAGSGITISGDEISGKAVYKVTCSSSDNFSYEDYLSLLTIDCITGEINATSGFYTFSYTCNFTSVIGGTQYTIMTGTVTVGDVILKNVRVPCVMTLNSVTDGKANVSIRILNGFFTGTDYSSRSAYTFVRYSEGDYIEDWSAEEV